MRINQLLIKGFPQSLPIFGTKGERVGKSRLNRLAKGGELALSEKKMVW